MPFWEGKPKSLCFSDPMPPILPGMPFFMDGPASILQIRNHFHYFEDSHASKTRQSPELLMEFEIVRNVAKALESIELNICVVEDNITYVRN